MKRQCPACQNFSVPISDLIVATGECGHCRAEVNVRGPYRVLFAIVITLIAVPSTLAVLLQQGIYAALLWLPFPIGALGFLRAKVCPLTVVSRAESDAGRRGAREQNGARSVSGD